MLQHLVDYFNHIPNIHRTLILVGGLTFFWLVESAVPLFKFSHSRYKHAALNLFFTLTTIIVNFAFAFLILETSDWEVNNNYGLLHLVKMPLWVTLIVGLLLLDLIGAFAVHWIQHKMKWMWKFHLIHHADTYVDTTTANRHHPGESVFRAVFTLLAVFVCGAPMWLVMLYQTLSAVFSQFNHANIRLPIWLDRSISWLIVSPDMHKVHHHFIRPQTDSNYGNIFSIWDRMFGTYNNTERNKLKYGVDVLKASTSSDLKFQLGIPFSNKVKTDY